MVQVFNDKEEIVMSWNIKMIFIGSSGIRIHDPQVVNEYVFYMYIQQENSNLPMYLFPKLFNGFSSFSVELMSTIIKLSMQVSKELNKTCGRYLAKRGKN